MACDKKKTIDSYFKTKQPRVIVSLEANDDDDTSNDDDPSSSDDDGQHVEISNDNGDDEEDDDESIELGNDDDEPIETWSNDDVPIVAGNDDDDPIDENLFNVWREPFHPNSSFKFPVTIITGRKRSCQHINGLKIING